MKLPLLAVLAACLAVPASAQNDKADLGFYPVTHDGYQRLHPTDEELKIINRKFLGLAYNGGENNFRQKEACMILPAADWMLADKTEELELKYLDLVASSLWSHEPLGVQTNTSKDWDARGGVISPCGSRHSPWADVDVRALSDDMIKACQSREPAAFAGKYASHGGMLKNPVSAVIETMPDLVMSPHEATALRALRVANLYQYSAVKLGKPISDIVRDTKASEAKRLRAIEILTDIRTGDETGHTLAYVWQDGQASDKLRIAALNDTGLILSFGDLRLHTQPQAATLKEAPPCGPLNGGMCDKLKRYLIPAMNLMNRERDNRDKLSPLGEAAKCVVERYPKEWRDAAKAGKSF